MTSHATLDDWIVRDAIRFTIDSQASVEAAVDEVLGSLGDVELLALGEALHGSEEILVLRNRVFQRLVEKHGYSAAVIEVTSPQARAINDYILGLRGAADEGVQAWLARNATHGVTPLEAAEDLNPFLLRQEATAHWCGDVGRDHPASLPKPRLPGPVAQPQRERRLPPFQAGSDQQPELPSNRARLSQRAHSTPPCT